MRRPPAAGRQLQVRDVLLVLPLGKIDRDRAALLAHVGAAVFFRQHLFDIIQHHRRLLIGAVLRPLVVMEDAEDIYVLERLGLGPSPVGAREKIGGDLEGLVHQRADFLLPTRGVVLFLLGQLKIAAELAEGFVGGEHQRLQKAVCAERPLPPTVAPRA